MPGVSQGAKIQEQSLFHLLELSSPVPIHIIIIMCFCKLCVHIVQNEQSAHAVPLLLIVLVEVAWLGKEQKLFLGA